MLILFVFGNLFLASASEATTTDAVLGAAHAAFPEMPQVQIIDQIGRRCGADDAVNPMVAYCTTSNTIFLHTDAATRPEAAYVIAHALGHAAQVRHGIADFALAQITARSSEEVALREMVEQQVDCLAGVFYARAGLPVAHVTDWFAADPFSDIHWGRDPLSAGPTMAIDLVARDAWFQIGQSAGTPAACAVDEIPVAPLMRAYRG